MSQTFARIINFITSAKKREIKVVTYMSDASDGHHKLITKYRFITTYQTGR